MRSIIAGGLAGFRHTVHAIILAVMVVVPIVCAVEPAIRSRRVCNRLRTLTKTQRGFIPCAFAEALGGDNCLRDVADANAATAP